MNDPFDNLPVFLAHSLALERESAERLREFAGIMHAHNQLDLAGTFEKLANYSELHAAEVEAICRDRQLPALNPWDYDWPDDEAPETCDYDNVRYGMTDREALEIMLAQENSAANFYAGVADRTTDGEVRRFALEFAAEERAHARALANLLARVAEGGAKMPDLDPPRTID